MNQQSAKPHLVWLYGGPLIKALDASTWLDTTNELRKLGWRVSLVVSGPSGQKFIRGTEVFCIYRPEKYLLRQFVYHIRFLEFLRQQTMNVDIVLFHQVSAPWLLPVRLLRDLRGRKRPLLVMDVRSLHMPLKSKQGWKGWLREMFTEFINRSAVRWIDGYLTITHRMAEAIGIPPNKIWGEWPSGVNIDLFSPAKNDRTWPLKGEPIRLIYIGALHYERNLMTLCHAVEQANSEGMSFVLWLAGKGTERSELEKYASRTHGRIRVLQPLPHNEIPQTLAQAHIGVLPFPDEIKFQVSSPIKLFEYMAAGMPILATRIACHTDVIGNNNYVFWAEKADESGLISALRQAWQNRKKLKTMGSQAFAAAHAWTWRESAIKLKLSLEHALEKDCV